MDTQHSLFAAAWHGLPLPIFEVAIDLDLDEADYPRRLARLVDTTLTYVLLVGMARCVDTAGWAAFAANLTPLFVDPGPGKRARAIRRLERHRPGCTGWQLDDPVEEGRALWTAVGRPRRQNAPSILECLEMLAQFRNKGPGHDELPVDVERGLGLAVRQTLPHLLDRNHYVKKARLLVLSDVSRVTGGQVEWTARVCAGAVPIPYGEGQRLRAPEERWMVRGAVCLRDRSNGELVSLDPFVRWHDEHMYLLHSLGGKAPCLLHPARRTELPTVDLDAFDRRLPGWRNARHQLQQGVRDALDDVEREHVPRNESQRPTTGTVGVWAHHDAPDPRVAGPGHSRKSDASSDSDPPPPSTGKHYLLWWAGGIGCGGALLIAGILAVVMRDVVPRGDVPSLILVCRQGWTKINSNPPVCMQTRETTWADVQIIPLSIRQSCRGQPCRALCNEVDALPANCICPAAAQVVCRTIVRRDYGVESGRLPHAREWRAAARWEGPVGPAVAELANQGRYNLCDARFAAWRETQPADSDCRRLECTPRTLRGDSQARTPQGDDEFYGVAPGGSKRDDRVGAVEDLYGNLSEFVLREDGQWAAAGRDFIAGIGEGSSPLWKVVPEHDHGARYGFRCVVPMSSE